MNRGCLALPRRQRLNNYVERASLGSLTSDLQQGICEVFIKERRIPLRDRPIFRRMLCTNNNEILGSFHGRTRLLFRPPKKRSAQKIMNDSRRNLICTWDILMGDHRYINLDDTLLIAQYQIGEKNVRKWMRKEVFIHPVNNMAIRVDPKDNFMGGLNFIRKYILDQTFLTLSSSERYTWMDT